MISSMIISQISKGSHERELALAHTKKWDLDSMHDDEREKKCRDIQGDDDVEEKSKNINGAGEGDNVEVKATNSSLGKQTSSMAFKI